MSSSQSRLVKHLERYVDTFNEGRLDEQLNEVIQTALADEDSPRVFSEIADRVWDRYSCIGVELMISILRRWLTIEPDSDEAKRALGSYLLAHGPDWDDEGRALLEEAS